MTPDEIKNQLNYINDQLERLSDRINGVMEILEPQIERNYSRIVQVENDLDYKIKDVGYDAQRDIDQLRTDLSNLEHKVNYG